MLSFIWWILYKFNFGVWVTDINVINELLYYINRPNSGIQIFTRLEKGKYKSQHDGKQFEQSRTSTKTPFPTKYQNHKIFGFEFGVIGTWGSAPYLGTIWTCKDCGSPLATANSHVSYLVSKKYIKQNIIIIKSLCST